MKANPITVDRLMKKLESFDGAMKVKIVCASDLNPKIHGKVNFNTIKLSPEERELQFAHDFKRPLYDRDNGFSLGGLLSQLRKLLENSSNVNKYSVCKRVIGTLSAFETHEPPIYLKNIKTKSEFESHSFKDDGIEDTIFLEFTR